MSTKIGIITIESFNYGNRLQNFALQHTLEKLGYEVETIQRNPAKSYQTHIKRWAKKVIQRISRSKGARFQEFDTLIRHSKYYATNSEISDNIKQHFDYFIAGSDQIWNPYYDFVGSVECLTFANPEQRIAYAGSFGISSLPVSKQALYKEWFSDFNHISVREEAGAQIIKQLTGKDVPVVLDPTLLLTASDWRSIEKKTCDMPVGDYVLVYYVEDMSTSFREAVEKAKKTMTVIDIKAKQKNGHEWSVGPSEFLWLIDHAEILYTDSFHGTVFSILFHTIFRVFERDGIKMNSRIDTLLNILAINQEKTDFTNVEKRLEVLRKDSIQFLKTALQYK